MNKKMILLSLGALALTACSSGGNDNSTPTEEEIQEIVVEPYRQGENGFPLIKSLPMGNLPKAKTKKIKIKNSLDADLVFATTEGGDIQMGFTSNLGPTGPYSYVSDCPERLSPNQMCEIRVTVDPDKTRARELRNVFYVNVQNTPPSYSFGNSAIIVEVISKVNQNPVVTNLASDISIDTYATTDLNGLKYQVIGVKNDLSLAVRDIKINLPVGYSFIYNGCPDVLEPGEICEAGTYYSGEGSTPDAATASVAAIGSNGQISYSFDIMQTYSHSADPE